MAKQSVTRAHRVQSQPQQALRRLAASVSVIQALILLAVVGVIVAASIGMNRTAIESQKELIDNALNQQVTHVINEQKSIAFWDEAARRLDPGAMDVEWADVEVGAYLSENYGHSEIYLVSPDNRSHYAFAKGAHQLPGSFSKRALLVKPLIDEISGRKKRPFRQREAEFEQQLMRYNELGGAKAGRAAANIMSIDGKPVIVSAISVIPTIDMTLAPATPAYLISLVPIDQKVIDQIGSSLLIPDLQLHAVRQGTLAFDMKPLIADDGSVPAELAWDPPTPGRLLILSILPLVLVASIVAAITTRNLLRRLIRASSDLAQREASARHQSLHDSLSGLPNRRSFLAMLDAGLKQSREDGLFNVVAYVDIDRFKDINDTLGHVIGDSLILKVGARLRKALPESDHVARLGGDEFAVLRRAAHDGDAHTLGRDICKAMDEAFDLEGQLTRIELSVGIAVAQGQNASAEMLLRHSDIALYDAKDGGRNRVTLFAGHMAAQLEDRYALEADLRTAVEFGNIHMLYQPLIDVQNQQISGVEALVRWKHPVRGNVPPSVFIPLAERAGLMPKLGQHIFNKVFADARRWPNLEVSVNLSPAQIRDINLVPIVCDLQEQFQIDPSRIIFEITEGILLEATDHALAQLADLMRLGYKIALDDFGTGYSSLSYLRQFEFHKLKIDRSFVQDIASKPQSQHIVQAIVTLGRNLGMRLVAEGVETAEEAETMRVLGCDEWQGYYFSHPIEPLIIDAFFEDHADTAVSKIIPL